MAGTRAQAERKPGTTANGSGQGKSGTKQHPAPAQQVQHDPYGHGHSVAAWTAVTLVMVGALLMSIAVALGWDLLWLFVVGAVVVVLGPVLGKILGAMGFGSQNRSAR